MRLALVTAPAKLPLDWDVQVKGHLRLDSDDEKARVVDSVIPAAARWCEAYTNRALITQTWKLYLDRFPPTGKAIPIPRPPLQSITHIKYYDGDGIQQTWSSANYEVDPPIPGTFVCAEDVAPHHVAPAFGQGYPSIQARRNAVEIQFVCGYGAAHSNVPGSLKSAMLLVGGELFANRELESSGAYLAAESLAAPFRVNMLGGPEPCDRIRQIDQAALYNLGYGTGSIYVGFA